MATLARNMFTTWEFASEQEAWMAAVLTELQEQSIQNLLAAAATERARIDYDPTNPEGFKLAMAKAQGQMDILIHIIAMSDAGKEGLQQSLRETTQTD